MLSLHRALSIGVIGLLLLALVPIGGEPLGRAPVTRLREVGDQVVTIASGDGSTSFGAPLATVSQAAAPSAATPPVETGCGAAEQTVSDTAELTEALAAARPGDTVVMADGVYEGTFVIRRSGTEESPIVLCGGRDAVLDAGSVDSGYGLHLRADHWVLDGFTVTNVQKGIMLDSANHNVLQGVAVHAIGDEGVHFRSGSSDNVLRDSEISDTGRRRERFGEGVYIGSAESNWCEISHCGPDRSDRNQVIGNVIRLTTSESIDIKEGTTGGLISGNTFSGEGMTEAEAWVNVKGNGYRIIENRGTQSPRDGFQIFIQADGWGQDTQFVANYAEVDGEGFGFRIDKDSADRTVLTCDNVVIDAGEGFSNLSCTIKWLGDGL